MLNNILIFLGILCILLIVGCPFYLSLLTAGSFLTMIVSRVSAVSVITGLCDGIFKTALVAVPFYVLAGCVMQHTSIGRRLVGAILPLVKHCRGGVALTGILSNEVFGAMSGSSPAACGTIGRVMFPMVAEENGEDMALGLFASAGSLAIIMPPSINMIVYGATTNTSTGALFLGGVLPSIIITIILGLYVVYISKPKHMKGNVKEISEGLRQGIAALMLPAIILGGIYTGMFTPTEAGVISVVYVIGTSFILREMTWKILFLSLRETVVLTAQIFILIAASTVCSQGLALTGIPRYLASTMGALSPFAFLLILNIILLIMGCFFEPGSAIIILAPVLAPIANKMGIDPVHIGLVFTVNLSIGMFTPPFGFNLFVVQSIFKYPLERIAKAVMPYIALYIVGLLIITYIPWVVTWLPRMAGY